MLAGYATCIAALPAIDHPYGILDNVVTRLSEVSIGILCARRAQLDGSVISTEVREDSGAQARQAFAGWQAALAARDVARLNLERSAVRSPVDGYVTNLNLYPGDYASAGAARLAVIDRDSYWVCGYFEETKLPHVHVGDKAEIRLLAGGPITANAHESRRHEHRRVRRVRREPSMKARRSTAPNSVFEI